VNRIFVTGVPRSGTSWVAEVLAQAPETALVSEPDNFSVDPFAGVAKLGLGFYPAIPPGQNASRYGVLWDLAFSGGWPESPRVERALSLVARLPRGPRTVAATAVARRCARRQPPPPHVVVKSVYAAFTVEWIVDRCGPSVVLMRRHPLNILASWLQLDVPPYPIEEHPVVHERVLEPLGISAPATGASRLERVVWTIAVLSTALDQAAANNPDWLVINHERLCESPLDGFRHLFEGLGLDFAGEAHAHVLASNRPGERYETTRNSRDLPEAWRRRLTPAQVREAGRVLQPFPLARELDLHP
jgi:hypothetical protein